MAVELPAHGQDPTPASEVSLDAYRDAVIGGRRNVSLVGHSFGGMVISAVAEAVPQRVGQLVYVAGYLPRSGESAYGLSRQDPGSLVGTYWHQDDPDAYGPATIKIEGIVNVLCADCSAERQTQLIADHRAEPVPPLGTPVTLTAKNFGSVPRYFVRTGRDNTITPQTLMLMLNRTPVAGSVTLNTSHAPFFTRPAELAAVTARFMGR